MSLRWRLALIFAGVVAVTLTAVSVGAYRSAERELVSGIDQFLEARADQLLATPPGQRTGAEIDTLLELFPRAGRQPGGNRVGRQRPLPRQPRFDDLRELLAGFDADARYQELDREGAAIGGFPLPVDDVDRAIAIGDGPRRSLRTHSEDGARSRMVTVARSDGGAVQVSRDLSESFAALNGLRTRLVGFGALGAMLAAVAGWFVASTLTRPLEKLRLAAGQIAKSKELDEPIPIDRQDEVGDLTASFNTMADALSMSRTQQRRLVLDAGHELRTPLTSLRTNVELLQRAHDLPERDRKEILDDVNFELTELSDMVNELVELATDTDHSDDPTDIVQLDELVGSVVERARRRTGRTITFESTPSVAEGRSAQLERAVANLLANAHKFSGAAEAIHVTVHEGVIAVRDHGPGVAVDERERIFDRFYRSDTSRTMPGSGLGLAIVSEVMAAHGGRAWVDEPSGGGSVFFLQLPEANV